MTLEAYEGKIRVIDMIRMTSLGFKYIIMIFMRHTKVTRVRLGL